jgi:hypothetical protein
LGPQRQQIIARKVLLWYTECVPSCAAIEKGE